MVSGLERPLLGDDFCRKGFYFRRDSPVNHQRSTISRCRTRLPPCPSPTTLFPASLGSSFSLLSPSRPQRPSRLSPAFRAPPCPPPPRSGQPSPKSRTLLGFILAAPRPPPGSGVIPKSPNFLIFPWSWLRGADRGPDECSAEPSRGLPAD